MPIMTRPIPSLSLTVIRLTASIAFAASLPPALPPAALASDLATKVPMSERIEILQRTYPDLIYSVSKNTLRLMNNSILVIDDGRPKQNLMKRQDGDLEDQLSQIYPMGNCYRGRLRNADAGLIRNEKFFRSAYGGNSYQVNQSSEIVDWFGTEIRFSSNHGAATALNRVIAELKKLPAELHNVLKAPRRVLEWSNVSDSDQLDVHAFGIAIDLDTGEGSSSWLRSGARIGRLARYNNKVHPEIIAIFEKHGFIWGGKWYHFDTNHFEYRPEMIAIGNLALKRGCEPLPAQPGLTSTGTKKPG